MPEKINEYIGNLKNKTSGGRRNVFLPGESWVDYITAKHSAMQAEGIKASEFDRRRMALNGWTDQDEAGLNQRIKR